MENFKARGSMRDKRLRYQYYPARNGMMVKLDIHHRDGGRNYFSGAMEARGIEMTISTVEIEASGTAGVTVEMSDPMGDGNGRILLAEVPRYSDKKLKSVVELFDGHARRICDMWAEDRDGTIALIRSVAAGEARLAA